MQQPWLPNPPCEETIRTFHAKKRLESFVNFSSRPRKSFSTLLQNHFCAVKEKSAKNVFCEKVGRRANGRCSRSPKEFNHKGQKDHKNFFSPAGGGEGKRGRKKFLPQRTQNFSLARFAPYVTFVLFVVNFRLCG
jgi:hypothetical protein